eukprot:CAMPEP_0116094616 /NCGR_PEP_ID=MMETSP0327-20121206/9229_1 /TAXON_ID=44447 /ORGANISM="Pseudo-nitzschia delicatissima, Strain B596" /LENGTH=1039 /DNA_ID=CAMNT_0003586237 /DNA_START=100 /DNA_END=3219 /DNA_ORIENTATION=-
MSTKSGMREGRIPSGSATHVIFRDDDNSGVREEDEKSSPQDEVSKSFVTTVSSGPTDEAETSPKNDSDEGEPFDVPPESQSFRFYPVMDDSAPEEEIVFVPESEIAGDIPSSRSYILDNKIMNNRKDSDAGVVFLIAGPEDQRAKFKINKHRIRKIMANGGDETATYPPDCYSLMSLYGPKSAYWWFSFFVFACQMSFLVLMLCSITSKDWKVGKIDDNPWDGSLADYIASEASPLLRWTQFMALITFVLFADSSMLDVITAVHTFPNFALATTDDKIWCMVLSCTLRFVQGSFASFVAFILVFTSDNVIDVILNFTALNFISALDEVAFEFAKSGKYGHRMEEKIKRIEELPLPVCMFRKHKHLRFWFTLVPILILTLLGFIYVVRSQESKTKWETWKFRVEFGDDPILQSYSGCYENDFDDSTDWFKRDLYLSMGDQKHEQTKAKFGFCNDNRQWVLYEDEHGSITDPCEAEVVIHSSNTDAFDIATVFLEDWFTSDHTPADLYFFDDDYMGTNLFCGQYLNNGVCDKDLNTAFHRYDDGDCCASTCTLPNCEVGGLENAFGSINTSGDGYADCIDPSMVNLTIYLSGFTSSRDPDVVILTEQNRDYIDDFQPDFYDAEPSDTLLSLYCDNIKVMKYYINKFMENKHETVQVADGARCEFRLENSTSSEPSWDDAAIWYLNYTIHQGSHYGDLDQEGPVLVQQSSFIEGVVFFDLMPKCYYDLFQENLETKSMYNRNEKNLQGRAVRWVLSNDMTETQCLYMHSMLSRYALAAINFAAPIVSPEGRDLWIEKQTPDLCNWKNVVCLQNMNTTELDLLYVDISHLNLTGYIPSEIRFLSTLARYDAANNTLTGSLPTEMGELSLLNLLRLHDNNLTGSIPTGVGLLTSIEDISLQSNQLTGSIPTEFGLLTNLDDLDLGYNLFNSSIPSEIGLATSLHMLRLNTNRLAGTIPSEIGLLTNLVFLELHDNNLTGPIPSELGLLTSLERFTIGNNSLTGLIPSEMASLPSLEELLVDASNIPPGMNEIDFLQQPFMGDFR